jgi:ubiquinone/menaquinone biosynthesis C-methylase UbiE
MGGMTSQNRSTGLPKPIEVVWAPVFARVYDTAIVLAQWRGLRDIRSDLLRRAKGRVLELGAGTGLNLSHYPETVSEVLLTEPDPHMASKLRKRAAEAHIDTSIVETPAERLPFEDSSVDTVVATLVLCTVKDPERVLSEVARVLRPSGTFLFAEHVRSSAPRAARWQDRLNRPWGWYAVGCRCNRDTLSAIEKASFSVTDLRRDRLRWISPVVRPLVMGAASHPAGRHGRVVTPVDVAPSSGHVRVPKAETAHPQSAGRGE